MSIAEIKAVSRSSRRRIKKQLRDALEAEISVPAKEPTTMEEYLGSLRGTTLPKPGWDDDEPLEDWEALRDDDASV